MDLAFAYCASVECAAGCAGTLEVGRADAHAGWGAGRHPGALSADYYRLATRVASQVTPTPTSINLGRLAYVQGGDIWVKTLHMACRCV